MKTIRALDETYGSNAESIVHELVANYAHVKVNLPEDETKWASGNGEGVWVTPCSIEDADKCRDDNSHGEDAFVRLCNQPIMHPLTWGDKIRVQTRGGNRPVAYLEEADA